MWGIHPPIFLIFEIRLVRYLEDPFAKSWVLGRPTVTSNIISRRNVICKNRLFTKKIADFSISFPVRMSLLRCCAGRFYTICDYVMSLWLCNFFFCLKKLVPLKLGQPWRRQAFYCRFIYYIKDIGWLRLVNARCCLSERPIFSASINFKS